jgi:prepilin-type N-terminal cleavage/methylation domain-containing protein
MTAGSLRLRRSLCAFTLIELLVVIGVLAIGVSLLLPILSGIQQRARNLKARAEAQVARSEPSSPTTATSKPMQPAYARVTGMEATVTITPRIAVGMIEPQSIYACAFTGSFTAGAPRGHAGDVSLELPLPPHVISLSDLSVSVDGAASDSVELADGRLVWSGALPPGAPVKIDVTYTAVGRGIYVLGAPRGSGVLNRFTVDLTASGSDVRFLQLAMQPTRVTPVAGGGAKYTWDYRRLMFGRPVALDVLGIAPIDRLGELSWLGPISVVVFGAVLGLVSRAFPIANFDRWMLTLVLGTFTSAYPLVYFAQQFVALPYAVAAAAGAVMLIIAIRAASIMGPRLGIAGVVVPAGLIMGLALEAAVRPQLQGLLLTLLVIGLFVAGMILAPRVRVVSRVVPDVAPQPAA